MPQKINTISSIIQSKGQLHKINGPRPINKILFPNLFIKEGSMLQITQQTISQNTKTIPKFSAKVKRCVMEYVEFRRVTGPINFLGNTNEKRKFSENSSHRNFPFYRSYEADV